MTERQSSNWQELSPITPHCCQAAKSLRLLVCCIRMSSGVPSPQCARPEWDPQALRVLRRLGVIF